MSDKLGEITNCYTMWFKRRSKHDAARVWRALTDPDEVAAWMEAPARIDLRPGGDWFIDFPAVEAGDGPMDGILFKIEEERVLAYVWGISVVQWTIEPEEDGCTYVFIHNGCADRGELEAGLAAGWHGFLDQFDAHLDGRTWSKEQAKADWERLHAPYDDQLNAVLVR
jgi:uncharacterized protein YndB with AHSA1/START domain